MRTSYFFIDAGKADPRLNPHGIVEAKTLADVTAAAEAFCLETFEQTRQGWGLDCAGDFAGDHGQTTEEYVAENGNPSDDAEWFINIMECHGFQCGVLVNGNYPWEPGEAIINSAGIFRVERERRERRERLDALVAANAPRNTPRTEARKEFLHGVFVTALEGGIGYWSNCERYRWWKGDEATLENADLDNFHAVIHIPDEDDADKATRVVNIDTIARGINAIVKGDVRLNQQIRNWITCDNRDNDGGNIDSDAADCIVQAGLFGEVVYG
jgi:hypothetical protein